MGVAVPDAVRVLVPLLNPNEREAQLAAVHVSSGQSVERGQPLFTFESTKAAADVSAPRAGFVVALRARPGERMEAGEVVCWIAGSPDWAPTAMADPRPSGREGVPDGLRITDPALELARQAGIELTSLPVGPLVTESMVRSLTADEAQPETGASFDPEALVIYGGGGHGKSLIDLIRALGGYRIVGLIDDSLPGASQVMGVPVLGGEARLGELYRQGVRRAVNAVGGIGDVRSRVRVFDRLRARGFSFPRLIHPAAWVEPNARLGEGVQIFPHAYVGSEVDIGFGVIVNTGAVVSHDCRLGDFVNISPGALLAGGVSVEEQSLIGMGVTLNLNVTVGAGARIGNSAVVKSDVPPGAVVRAGSVWPA
jgi:sugar O-acyltransferase (sialic acid O-acetyltransferase NeuD family)